VSDCVVSSSLGNSRHWQLDTDHSGFTFEFYAEDLFLLQKLIYQVFYWLSRTEDDKLYQLQPIGWLMKYSISKQDPRLLGEVGDLEYSPEVREDNMRDGGE